MHNYAKKNLERKNKTYPSTKNAPPLLAASFENKLV
jgi:hypothetical protein